MIDYELLIERNYGTKTWQKPAVIEPVEWETYRKDTPSKLTFKVVKDDALGFLEGARVSFKVNGKKVFLGYVFEKSRDKDQLITVTAYDQLRYFKCKNAYVFENMKASTFIKRACDDFLITTGEIEDTGHAIGQILYTNDTLFDMIQGSLDDTVMATNQLFCIYDDYGEIKLKNIKNLKLDYMVTANTAENFDYTSSIDTNTYNRIKIQKVSKDKGISDIIVEEDKDTIHEWGVLQKFEQWGENQNEAQVKAMAKSLLKLHNSKTRSLSISGCVGDIRVRAGTSVLVKLALGDIPQLNNYMLVEEASHTFEQGSHTMSLTVKGVGEFYD
ncbi:MAG: hydrolase [Alphaproteobacteria bacterium]|nr:hydrolase [Alphaproteobacteria bacterium]